MKRSDRIVDMTRVLLSNPYKIYSLSHFTDKYDSAKSSISEDLSIIKENFESNGVGIVETIIGANGGVRYVPDLSYEKQVEYIDEIIEKLDNPRRILPGGYFYISDIISNPFYLKKIAKIIASKHKFDDIDYIITVATKGVTIAQAVSYELGVPIVIARKESKITEGPTVSVKYRSQSSPNLVKNMEVGRDSIKPGSKVLLVDDFFRGGGTINGMATLVEIFESEIIASYVICEFKDKELTQKVETKSLVEIDFMDTDNEQIVLKRGSII